MATTSIAAPVILATWPFGRKACEVGWKLLDAGGTSLDAIEAGINAVEENPAVASVGFGGLPNAEGVVELDAAIMDGPEHRAGAVAALTGVRRPISVARRVMERLPHVMVAGDHARRFALAEGFPEEELLTDSSRRRFEEWRRAKRGVEVAHFDRDDATSEGHDTVGACALDRSGRLGAGCSTSGLAWKQPGRVGDSPIIGSGLYVDQETGAAAATGNGDEIMKVCLSYRVVSLMAQGRGPQDACEEAIRYLLRKRPDHQQQGAACIALARDGSVGAAATRTGFRAPDRLWTWAVARDSGIELREGTYVDP